MAIPTNDRANFDMLSRAFDAGHVALMEVQRVEDGKTVAAVCAVGFEHGEYTFTPFAVMVQGNPFELFRPPAPDGGFYSEVSE